MSFIADFHIHSRYSRATSRDLDFESLAQSGLIKGVSLIGTGDFTHPGWLSEIETKLEPGGAGLFKLKDEKSVVRFILSAEISSIYSYGGKTRKVHSLILMPDLDSVKKFNAKLERIGNLTSDGRPILGLDARNLLEIMLECSESAALIPAHIWTPWFSVLGSKSGFDSIEECFRDLSGHIFALETGLSSDPAMNWMVSSLDRYTLVSNSDAHSASKVGREANLFTCRMDYHEILRALRGREGFAGTIEFFPEEGKYHYDGHRACEVRFSPEETRKHRGLCPVCKAPLTLGVMYRVSELKDREQGFKPPDARPFRSIFSLKEVLGEILQAGPQTKGVIAEYDRLIGKFGPELVLLLETPLTEFRQSGMEVLAEALKRMREGKVSAVPGYDGEFGVISVFAPGEIRAIAGQAGLFGEPEGLKVKRSRAGRPGLKKKPVVKTPDASGLNAEQAAAAGSKAAQVIVTAGPGTGKTRVLVERMRRLAGNGVSPSAMLALTFSTRAAREMEERWLALTGDAGPLITTFHGLGMKLLSEDTPVSLVSDEKYLDAMEAYERFLLRDDAMPEDLKAYCAYKKDHGLLDYPDLLHKPLLLFKDNPEILARCRRQWPHVFIDEYQDINLLQYRMVRALCPEESRLFVIGDPDQAIYGFRGADKGHFERFSADYPASEAVAFGQSYRCTDAILKAAGRVLGKPAAGGRKGGKDPVISRFPTEDSEAEHLVKTIEELIGGSSHFALDSGRGGRGESGDISFKDIAVLYRVRSAGDAVERALSRSGIPCQRLSRKKGRPEEDSYDPRAEGVRLMTLHASKGLEWKAVFIVGCEKGYLPYEEEGRVSEPEEERRLLYVGMTRARDSLFLSFSERRMIYGQRKKREMSPFLSDRDVKIRSPFKARAPEAEQMSLL